MKSFSPPLQPARSQRDFQQHLQSRDGFSNCRSAAAPGPKLCCPFTRESCLLGFGEALGAAAGPGVRLQLLVLLCQLLELAPHSPGAGANSRPATCGSCPCCSAGARPACATQQQLCSGPTQGSRDGAEPLPAARPHRDPRVVLKPVSGACPPGPQLHPAPCSCCPGVSIWLTRAQS